MVNPRTLTVLGIVWYNKLICADVILDLNQFARDTVMMWCNIIETDKPNVYQIIKAEAVKSFGPLGQWPYQVSTDLFEDMQKIVESYEQDISVPHDFLNI